MPAEAQPVMNEPSVPVRLAISWLTNALVLLVVVAVLSGAHVTGAAPLLEAAAVFGVLNTVLKPFVRLITLPLAVLTLGIAWFFVSMLMLWLTDVIVGGFHLNGFGPLVQATLIVAGQPRARLRPRPVAAQREAGPPEPAGAGVAALRFSQPWRSRSTSALRERAERAVGDERRNGADPEAGSHALLLVTDGVA